jgi:hypothetical protein
MSEYTEDMLVQHLEENANAGYNFLLHHDPIALERVDISKLDMYSTAYCVLGQAYDSFEEGLMHYPGMNTEDMGFSADELAHAELGYSSTFVYNTLTSIWGDILYNHQKGE